jgi:hypothetical protein
MSQFRVGQVVHVRQSTTYYYHSDYDGVIVRTSRDVITIMTTRHGSINKLHSWEWHRVQETKAKDAIVLRACRPGDRYWHYGVKQGRKIMIRAGCQHFLSLSAARNHWRKRMRFPALLYDKKYEKYNSKSAVKLRAKDARLNKWSLDFVKRLEKA